MLIYEYTMGYVDNVFFLTKSILFSSEFLYVIHNQNRKYEIRGTLKIHFYTVYI